MSIVGGIVKDQAEADEDLSMKERVALGAGSATKGVAELDSVIYEGKVIGRVYS